VILIAYLLDFWHIKSPKFERDFGQVNLQNHLLEGDSQI